MAIVAKENITQAIRIALVRTSFVMLTIDSSGDCALKIERFLPH
jgi:hypothetical protein